MTAIVHRDLPKSESHPSYAFTFTGLPASYTPQAIDTLLIRTGLVNDANQPMPDELYRSTGTTPGALKLVGAITQELLPNIQWIKTGIDDPRSADILPDVIGQLFFVYTPNSAGSLDLSVKLLGIETEGAANSAWKTWN